MIDHDQKNENTFAVVESCMSAHHRWILFVCCEATNGVWSTRLLREVLLGWCWEQPETRHRPGQVSLTESDSTTRISIFKLSQKQTQALTSYSWCIVCKEDDWNSLWEKWTMTTAISGFECWKRGTATGELGVPIPVPYPRQSHNWKANRFNSPPTHTLRWMSKIQTQFIHLSLGSTMWKVELVDFRMRLCLVTDDYPFLAWVSIYYKYRSFSLSDLQSNRQSKGW